MLIHKQTNIFNDDIAYVEQHDFSQANLNEGNRLLAITTVASICYQNPKAIGSESLYNRLLAESHGLPSSSFEMVPVLFDMYYLSSFLREKGVKKEDTNIFKYGEKIEIGNYLLTNFRAVIYDFENLNIDLRHIFNTPEECEIIKQHFKVFKFHVDFPTRSQMVRHRVNWQELSRRYVSGERVPFEFYISDKMKNVKQTLWIPIDDNTQTSQDVSTEDLIDVCIRHYKQALEQGVKPQEARRIIPQAAYSTIWGAFQPTQLANFFKLRDDSHAQWEIQQTAKAMKYCIQVERCKDILTPEREATILARMEAHERGEIDFLTAEELDAIILQKQLEENS